MTDRDATAEFAEFIAEVAAKARASERNHIRQLAIENRAHCYVGYDKDDKDGTTTPRYVPFADLLDGGDDG